MESPYMSMGDNPILSNDPNGELEDWYMNQKSGELYYNENQSSQTVKHDNETYTRNIGDNNMFGDMGKIKEKSFNYEQSQGMAQQHNFSIVPTEQLCNKEFSVNYIETGPGRSVRVAKMELKLLLMRNIQLHQKITLSQLPASNT